MISSVSAQSHEIFELVYFSLFFCYVFLFFISSYLGFVFGIGLCLRLGDNWSVVLIAMVIVLRLGFWFGFIGCEFVRYGINPRDC